MKRVGMALLLSVAACEGQPPAAKVGADGCLDLPVYPPAGMTDLKQEVFVCVERNAAMYAKGPDSPEALSLAVIAKCEPTIIRYLEQENQTTEGLRYKQVLEAWRKHALPVIAEARARNCYS